MNKLWENGKQKLNPIIEAFETKADLLMDQKLVKYDVLGSIAHAKMLKKIGILTEDELLKLEKGLLGILKLYEKGKFKLEFGDEDIHTKIENFLIEKYGEIGKKIHTGRSRNDQVLTVLRLYSKENISDIKNQLVELIKCFKKFSKKYGYIKMPGYTHMQKAMPSSIGFWVNSFIESFQDDLIFLKTVYKFNNQSPLGSGAGYGIPIKIDREYTANILDFAKVQQTTYCQNSRGKIEAIILSSLISILQTINKFASDVLMFTTHEFNFFDVDQSIITGSSIMPQKKNIDVAELLRSKVHLVLGNYVQIVSLSSNLFSGYNRDFQDTKKPLIESFEIIQECLKVTQVLAENIVPNITNLEMSMTKDLFATDEALKLVLKGDSFRNAYQKVAKKYMKGGDK